MQKYLSAKIFINTYLIGNGRFIFYLRGHNGSHFNYFCINFRLNLIGCQHSASCTIGSYLSI